MTKLTLCAAAAAIIALPAVAEAQTKRSKAMARGSSTLDASTETGNTRRAPDIQARAASRLQTGSGQESGGYAREGIRR